MLNIILYIGAFYLAIGVLFGVIFLLFRINKVDVAAVGSSVWFKLMILPGIAALWPVLVSGWLKGVDGQPIERTAHRDAGRKLTDGGVI